MVDVVQETDPLWMLLQRALDDDETEGDVAWSIFARKAKGRPGTIFFLADDDPDPLMPLIRDLRAALAAKTEEAVSLRQQMERQGIAPKKAKEKSFPWEKYPALEMDAFAMIFRRGLPMQTVIDHIRDRAPEAENNTTFLNQRFIQGRPSTAFEIKVKSPKDGSEITWDELWRIGTLEHADSWIQRVIWHGGAADRFYPEGSDNVPKNWHTLDPNTLIDPTGRKTLRRMYKNKEFKTATVEILSHVADAGWRGISRSDLKKRGIAGRRMKELYDKSNLFDCTDDQIVHYQFASIYPHDNAARQAALKFPKEQVAFEATVLPAAQVHAEASTA